MPGMMSAEEFELWKDNQPVTVATLRSGVSGLETAYFYLRDQRLKTILAEFKAKLSKAENDEQKACQHIATSGPHGQRYCIKCYLDL